MVIQYASGFIIVREKYEEATPEHQESSLALIFEALSPASLLKKLSPCSYSHQLKAVCIENAHENNVLSMLNFLVIEKSTPRQLIA